MENLIKALKKTLERIYKEKNSLELKRKKLPFYDNEKTDITTKRNLIDLELYQLGIISGNLKDDITKYEEYIKINLHQFGLIL